MAVVRGEEGNKGSVCIGMVRIRKESDEVVPGEETKWEKVGVEVVKVRMEEGDVQSEKESRFVDHKESKERRKNINFR